MDKSLTGKIIPKYSIGDIRTLFEWDKSLDTKSTKVTRDYDNIHVNRMFQGYKRAFIDLGLLGGLKWQKKH